jgi:hypothetical protein
MPAYARREIVAEAEVGMYHCMARCEPIARRANREDQCREISAYQTWKATRWPIQCV